MSYQRRIIDNSLHRLQCYTAQRVDAIEAYAKDRAYKDSIDEYEAALSNQAEALKRNVDSQLDDFHSDILSRRPSPNDPDFDEKQEQYKEFLLHAKSGLSTMKASFNKLFEKLKEVFKRIVMLVIAHAPDIISMIATIFGSVILPLLGLC